MNVFDTHSRIVVDYATYIRSFLNIADPVVLDAHDHFSTLMDRQRFRVVYPVPPMDLLGVYVLLPA